MSAYRIRQVKKEIRTLGLAAGNAGSEDGFLVVGVVFRGGLWLDGAMRTKTSGADVTEKCVEMITASRHHPQIRAILVHGDLLLDGSTIDPIGLSGGASRPVIALNFEVEPGSDDPYSAQVHPLDLAGRGAPSYSIGLESQTANEILLVASRDYDLPEALRVAGLLLSAFKEPANISFKNDSTA